MSVDENIEAFLAKKDELEATHMGEWVVVHDCKISGFYPTFEDAAEYAVENFQNGSYVIRQVGAPSITLPASVMYNLQ